MAAGTSPTLAAGTPAARYTALKRRSFFGCQSSTVLGLLLGILLAPLAEAATNANDLAAIQAISSAWCVRFNLNSVFPFLIGFEECAGDDF